MTDCRSAWDMWDKNTPEGDYSATLDGQELSPIDPVLRTDTDFTNIIDRRVKEFYDTYSPGKGEVLVEGGDLLWKSSEVDSLMALLALASFLVAGINHPAKRSLGETGLICSRF